MSFENPPKLHHTLAFRLTLWYAGIFTLASGVAFFFFYLLITSVIREQTDQELLGKVSDLSAVMAVRGIDGVRRVTVIEAQAAGEKKIFFRLLYRSGQVFSSSNMAHWQNIGVSADAVRHLLERGGHVFETVSIAQRPHPVRTVYGFIGQGVILQMGQSLENYARLVAVFRTMFFFTMAGILVVAAIIGWFMARRAMGGVWTVIRTARRISQGALHERVPVHPRKDEIDQLALTFNRMLDRIEGLVSGIQEMSDNIAHDLRSPVTRIRGLAEVTLTTGRSKEEFEQMAASTIEDCDRLLDMINTMLLISRTEAGVERFDSAPVDLAAVACDACDLFGPMAEDGGIELDWNACPSCIVSGDVAMLQRMIANLLDNAIKYTASPGRVTVRLDCDPAGQTRLTVGDTGHGIDRRDLPHIFERFFRCDQSRSRAGTGLGLSLARAVARAHGGDITVTSTPGMGSTFTVSLPAGRPLLPPAK
ncbi:MAG: HAMP domain-containing protein [Desulfobacterales bacterium]|nr:HAMP domain-containing protein [Desulfobacterales bacterium]